MAFNKEKILSEFTGKEITSPVKAIRAKCLDCCCYQANEVDLCTCNDCPLFPFRYGKNPYSNKTMTDEQRKAASDRIKKMLADKNNT